MTASFAADIGSDYRGSPPLEDPAGVATPPEPDEGDQPNQRNRDIAHDAADRVERPMQRGYQQVSSQDDPGETRAAAAGSSKDRAAEERGPQPMTKGRQHTTHQLSEDDRVQREDQLVPLDDEERHQRVAAALQRGETKADRCAQDHAVADMKPVDAEGHHHDEHALDELLDQPDFERADEAGPDQPVLEQRGTEHPHDAANKEGGHDSPWRKRRTGVVIEVPDDRRNGHQETAEKNDGGQQNDVVGDAR